MISRSSKNYCEQGTAVTKERGYMKKNAPSQIANGRYEVRDLLEYGHYGKLRQIAYAPSVRNKIASAVTKSRNNELKFSLDVECPLQKPISAQNAPAVTKLLGYMEFSRKCTVKSKMHDKVENAR